MNETDEARAELKIRRIANGWLLKSRTGWTAHENVDGLVASILRALTIPESATEDDGQKRFFSSAKSERGGL